MMKKKIYKKLNYFNFISMSFPLKNFMKLLLFQSFREFICLKIFMETMELNILELKRKF